MAGTLTHRTISGRRGSGLIVVLWVAGLLGLLVSSFVFDARIEARIISYYRKRSKAEYIAKSGVELATMLIKKSSEAKASSVMVSDEDDPWHEDALKLSRGLAVRGLEHELGDGKIILDIEPEPARRNINSLGVNDMEKEQNLERILEVGGITEDTGLWPELIESFLDWTDQDNLSRAAGAETEDYYAGLEHPYKAKNGPLDTVEELLLVKGYKPAMLFGGILGADEKSGKVLTPVWEDEEVPSMSGIQDLLTTYGDGKVNINASTARVLMTLPGVDEVVAGAIVEEREGTATDNTDTEEDYSYRDVNDMFARIPGLDPAIRQYVSTASTIYRITSVGDVGGVKKKVWCVANFNGKDLMILRWREEDFSEQN